MADATIDDVHDLIDTELDDVDIQPILYRAARDIGREYDEEDFADEQHRADLESALTAYRIITGRDRQPTQIQLGNAMQSYGSANTEWLRGMLRRLDPGDAFSVGSATRDSDRYVNSANNDND